LSEVVGLLKPCLDCGDLSGEIRCVEHSPNAVERRTTSSRARGYDAAWDRLSARARRLQPWCLDCGTTEELTADHLPSAWQRKAAGLPLRLADVEVVCADCNAKRGSSRPGTVRASGWRSFGGHLHAPNTDPLALEVGHDGLAIRAEDLKLTVTASPVGRRRKPDRLFVVFDDSDHQPRVP
jgi:5-methylcytosine-specific restriction protein A